ncbi:DUF4923 family protein [uncultured Duncaniella sp.]|uniref:lipocalin-like domain-containing protein n=2 Tax=uncultured Duncaniella sp. TaxID=2768039 RepID=UPI0025EFF06F|nr:DUF4923 family protein [uncultured Duncaniella sp.]
MKKSLHTLLLVLGIMMSATTPSMASQWDLNSVLGKLGNASTATDSTATNSGSSSTGGLGALLSGVANKLGVGSSTLTVDKLVGTWNYAGPAVSFQSDNFLLKAGGAAAASQVEAKLEPYYKTAGFTSLVLTINNDSTFNFKARLINMNGVITKNTETGNFIFQFKALKSINIGSMESYVVMNGNKMELTFDVSKLMVLVEKAGKITGNNTVKTLSTLLNKYDGMTAGFELQRQ